MKKVIIMLVLILIFSVIPAYASEPLFTTSSSAEAAKYIDEQVKAGEEEVDIYTTYKNTGSNCMRAVMQTKYLIAFDWHTSCFEGITTEINGKQYYKASFGRENSVLTSKDRAKALKKAKKIAAEAGKKSTRYKKIKYINKWLIDHLEYDDTPKSNTAYCLVSGKAVCAGYAKAFVLICAEAGIPANYVTGTVKDYDDSRGNHAWAVVKLGKKWYSIDPTWNDKDDGDGKFFLRGMKNKKGKKNYFWSYRSRRYDTKSTNSLYAAKVWTSKHPMAKYDYQP